MDAAVESDWREDLNVMDKLLRDETSRVSGDALPQAMGIRLRTIGQTEPMYLEGFGALFSYRVNIPLAGGKGGAGGGTRPAAPPTAWDRARDELSGRRPDGEVPGQWTLRVPGPPPTPFDQAKLDELVNAIVRILPEARNFRHLADDEYVVVTIAGASDAAAPMRMTFKARKSDIDQAAAGKITPAQFNERVSRRIG